MKKVLMMIVLTLICTSVFSAIWENRSDYKEYIMLKSVGLDADFAGNTFVAVKSYIKAGELAQEKATELIASWRYNDAGYCLIKKYKQVKDKTLLTEALDYLKIALSLSTAESVDKIKSNIKYCEEELNKR